MRMLLQLALLLILIQGSQVFGGRIGPVAASTVILLLALGVALLTLLNMKRDELSPLPYRRRPLMALAALLAVAVARTLVDFGANSPKLMPVIVYTCVGVSAFLLARLNREAAIRVGGCAAACHVLIAIAEGVSGQSFFYGQWKVAEAQYYGGLLRLSSSAGDPNYLALTLVLLAPFLWLMAKKWAPYWRVLSIGLVGAVIVFTFSRAVYVAVGVLALVGLCSRVGRHRVIAVAACCGVLVSLVALAQPSLLALFADRVWGILPGAAGDASSASRIATQGYAFELWLERPFFGHGLGSAPDELGTFARSLVPLDAVGNPAFLAQTSVLNTYLLVALELGVVGLVGLVGLLWAVWRATSGYLLLRASVIAAGVMLVSLDAIYFAPFWFFVGVSLASPPIASDCRGEMRLASSLALVRG